MMKRQGRGKIINMTSVAARNGGGPGSAAYATAKGGVSTLTRAMAKELVGAGILVNGVAPGIITTPFHDRFTPPDIREALVGGIPIGREGTPEEVAATPGYYTGEYLRALVHPAPRAGARKEVAARRRARRVSTARPRAAARR
jgi:3-oxoacyl-[acyl-carrier protein] reductase